MWIHRFMSFFCALAVSLVLTPIIMSFSKKHNIFDIPNNRKVHKKPIPLLGGVAIYLGFLIAVVLFADISAKLTGILISTSILVALGVVDDIKNVQALVKLFVQAVCAFIVVMLDIRINFIQNIISNKNIAIFIDSVITICWIIGITNAINLIDGLDGLAGGISIIAAMGFAIISLINRGTSFILLIPLVGSILGFLFYNFNPAKIFMGDTGSTFIGFILGVSSVILVNNSANKASILATIIILALPIYDTGNSILRRLMSKRDILAADDKHLHHVLMKRGLNQRESVITLYILGLFSMIIGVIVEFYNFIIIGAAIVILLILLGLFNNVPRISFESKRAMLSEKYRNV